MLNPAVLPALIQDQTTIYAAVHTDQNNWAPMSCTVMSLTHDDKHGLLVHITNSEKHISRMVILDRLYMTWAEADAAAAVHEVLDNLKLPVHICNMNDSENEPSASHLPLSTLGRQTIVHNNATITAYHLDADIARIQDLFQLPVLSNRTVFHMFFLLDDDGKTPISIINVLRQDEENDTTDVYLFQPANKKLTQEIMKRGPRYV